MITRTDTSAGVGKAGGHNPPLPPVSRISGLNLSESDLRGHSRGGTVCFTDGPERLSHQSRTARTRRNFRRSPPTEPRPWSPSPNRTRPPTVKPLGNTKAPAPTAFTSRRRSRTLFGQEAGAAALARRRWSRGASWVGE